MTPRFYLSRDGLFPLPQSGHEAQPPRKWVRETIQLDADLTRAGSAFVASQAFLPTETSMGPLRTGKRRR